MNVLLAVYTRLQVLAKSVLARLSALLAILVYVSDHLNEFGPVPEWVVQWLPKIIGLLTIVVLQVRKHTPVADDQKGLLPPKGPGTPTVNPETGELHIPDAGLSLVEVLVAGMILIAFAYFVLR